MARAMDVSDRKQIQLAMWAESVSERMAMVDRVWRRISEPVPTPRNPERPKLIQVVRYGNAWAYPLYLDGAVTRVLPHGGVPVPMKDKAHSQRGIQLDLESA